MIRAPRAAVLLTVLAMAPGAFGAALDDESPAPATPAPPAQAGPPVEGTPHDDGRRTTGRFFGNLGRNAVGLFSGDNIVPAAIGTGATLLATPFDDNVQRYFGGGERKAAWLGDFADWLGRPIVLTPIAATLYIIGRKAPNHKRFHEATYDIAQVFLLNAAVTTAIKYPAHRLRPDESNYLSFPSGHTSNAFAWATVAAHYYGPKLGVPAFAFASLIGVGRMEKNVHWLSDVVGGASVGYLVGRTVLRRDSEPLPGHQARMTVFPSAGPQGKGVGLTASVQF